MSNHFSAANLKSPGGDPRLDFTDLFVFQSPSAQDRTVLISNYCPLRSDQLFNPDAVYRINIDNDGDAYADVAFNSVFSEPAGGVQAGTVYQVTGDQAREANPTEETLIASVPVGLDAAAQPVEASGIKVFVGVRSDPFFADAEGPFHDFHWTGVDTFADKNVLTIALEVPSKMLGSDPRIGAWATVSKWQDGMLTQMDRGGNPTINPFINPDDKKDEYNARQPVDDVTNYLEPWSKVLEDQGGYSPSDAKDALKEVLPDILRYDRSQPVGYPNGRYMTNDVYSHRFAWLSKGKVPPDGLQPHGDLLPEFPYLGVPNS